MSSSVERLEIVAKGLNDLVEQFVFVGGATTVLYIDSSAAPEPRPTDDVDCVIEIAGRLQNEELEKKLRSYGFSNDRSIGAPVCRWIYSKIKVDIMLTNDKFLGFTSKWYSSGVRLKTKKALPSGRDIYIFTLPYFIASKLEAFNSRGAHDPRTSPDIEDIIFVLEGCFDPLKIILDGEKDVRKFLAQEFTQLSKNSDFIEAIEGSLRGEGTARINRAKQIVGDISSLN